MNIKTRLSFQFTFIVFLILLLFSVLAYYFTYTSQRSKFHEDLLDKAKNTAILLINVAEVDSALLKKIHQSTVSFEKEEIALTDSALQVIYSNKIESLNERLIRQKAHQGDINFFSVGEKDGVCYRHKLIKQSFYVFVMAQDKSRKQNLADLRNVLLWSNLFSLWFSVFISYFFSRNAIQPISQIIKNINNIDSTQLSLRLNEGNKKDEIAQLSISFNKLLTDLEIVFKNQEDFVSNASHELRTPLSVMTVENDYILKQVRKPEEYIKHLIRLADDLKKINSLLSSLLELAHINRDISVSMLNVRVDEVVFNAVDEIKLKYAGRKFIFKILYPENENDLVVKGNPGLLLIAFKNLIENACKFSDREILIEFEIAEDSIKVIIADQGIGIPPAELKDIFKPFNRGSNAKFIGGFGIGLTLVYKIIEHHKAEIKASSKLDSGTQMEILFLKGHK
jgi:signal transduction histidine kinase